MIPVEKIAGGTLGNLLYYVAIIGVLLVICTIIRLKVSFLRKAFIPASLLAGILGMILGPHVLGVIPADMMSSIGAIPSHMITIVFACMMLGVRKSENTSSMMHDAAAGLGWLWSNSFMQVGVACLLCSFLFTPVFGVNELFGSLFEIGFAGGHGTAGGMASVFTDTFNWADGADLGKTTATIGLLAGIFGGMAIINIAVRKKWTKVLTEPASGNAAKEVFDEGDPNHEPSAYATISQDVVEPFAFHLGIIGLAILIGRLIVWGFGQIFGYSGLPLFPFAMIGGWVINIIAQRVPLLRALFGRGAACPAMSCLTARPSSAFRAWRLRSSSPAQWLPSPSPSFWPTGRRCSSAPSSSWSSWCSGPSGSAPASSTTAGLSRPSSAMARSAALQPSATCFCAALTPRWRPMLVRSTRWTAL